MSQLLQGVSDTGVSLRNVYFFLNVIKLMYDVCKLKTDDSECIIIISPKSEAERENEL